MSNWGLAKRRAARPPASARRRIDVAGIAAKMAAFPVRRNRNEQDASCLGWNYFPILSPVSRSSLRESAVESAPSVPTITARFFARVMPV